jgi:hypothetical protein
MPASSITDADCRLLAKFLLLFDSPQEGEATAAMVQARALLRKRSTPLYEAIEKPAFKTEIWESQGHPVCLQEHFEASRVRQLNAKLEKQCDELVDAVTRLREIGKFCRACQSKRGIIAVMLAVPIAYAWFTEDPADAASWTTNLYGVLLTLTPLLYVFCRWKVIHFKRDLEWVSGTDNNLYRAIAAKWNRLLARLALS